MSARLTDSDGPPDGYVLLGRLGRTFGLSGALHFYPEGPAEAEAIATQERLFVSGQGVLEVREVRRHGKDGLVLAFEAVRRPERAQRLVNSSVHAPAEALPEAADAGPYLDSLRGLPVLLGSEALGSISDVTGVPGAEILTVETRQGGELLLPLHAPYVELLDDAVRLVDPPPGLLDDGGNS